MAEQASRRLTLLFQLYLASQASRRFMRVALADAGMSGEEYAICSYLYANGPRPLSQTAREFGVPITTLAGLLSPLVDSGDLERLPHPSDRRARLLALTAAGRDRLEQVIPEFTIAYRGLLAQLNEADVDAESIYAALGALREGVVRTTDLLEAERSSVKPPS